MLRERRAEILVLARKHGASDLRVFGSVARGEADDRSDLDLLVHFDVGRTLLEQIALSQALEQLLGVHVDVLTEGGLSPYIHDQVMREAVPV
jgi:hypothetical protein